MISQELLAAVSALSTVERLSLLELLITSIQADMDAAKPRPATLDKVLGMLKPDRPVPDLQQELERTFLQQDVDWGLIGEE